MRTATIAPILFLALLVGCAQDPQGRIYSARVTNAELTNLAADLVEQGTVDKPTGRVVLAVSEEVTKTLDDAQAVLLKGDALNASFLLRRAESVLLRLSATLNAKRRVPEGS